MGHISLLIFKESDNEDDFENVGYYTEYPQIPKKLASASASALVIELNDGEVYHKEISLGNSIGPTPEWKANGNLTRLSHGMFLQSDKGVRYGLSAGHGFKKAAIGTGIPCPAP